MPRTTIKTWDADLPEMNLQDLPTFYDPLEGCEVDAARKLSADRSYRRTPTERTMMDMRRVADVVTHIGRLPRLNETIHLVAAGSYSLFDHIPATLDLVKPARLAYLGICTLSFSAQNVEALIGLLGTGRIDRLDLIYSCYFKSVERGTCERLTAELTHRGARVVSLRVHAKILLMQTTGGDAYVAESSANLRSRGNVEQSAFSNSPKLLRFHAEWFDELLSETAI